MAISKESTPPPIIGKAGSYTVFLTPSPKPTSQTPKFNPPPCSPQNVVVSPPPVQPPPQQFHKPRPPSFGFFWDAVSKVQNAHSSLDEYLADWFGLNRSKYQWALDDYLESKGVGNEDAKLKEVAGKGQSV